MAILKSEITFGIVLYKEELQSSITFTSLIESITINLENSNEKISLLVYDNTNRVIGEKENKDYIYNENIKVHYFTDNQNNGLPYAYNFFVDIADKLGKKWIVLLDQDTELPKDIFAKYLHADDEKMVHCPLVFSNGSLMSPSYYKNYRSSLMEVPEKSSFSLKNVSCINSGLMINVEFFQKIGGYNSKLFLDFCDHDFIEKIKKNKIEQLGIIDTRLIQEFSAVTNTKEQALYRYSLFLKDLNEYKKGKSIMGIFFMVDLPRVLKLTFQYKSLKFILKRFF